MTRVDRSRGLSTTHTGERWLGVKVGGSEITLVDVEIESAQKAIMRNDLTIRLQKGARPAAYAILHGQIVDYIGAHAVKRLVVKASGVSKAPGKIAPLLETAEVRGVVMCAAGVAGCEVDVRNMAADSRNFGDRKAAEYLRSDNYWAGAAIQPPVRTGSREAAFLLLAALGDVFAQ